MSIHSKSRLLPAGLGTVRSWSEAGEEPHLADVMSDPIVHLVMARDKLSWDDMERAIARGQRMLRSRLCTLCAA